MTRNRLIAAVIAVIIVIAVIVVLVVTLRSDNESPSGGGGTATDETAIPPADLSEFTGKLDLRDLKNTTFISLLVPDEDGRPTGYMLDSEREEAEPIIKAVSGAKKIDGEQPTTLPTMTDPSGTADDEGLTPTIAFVLTSRQMVTFVLDLETGLLFREGDAFRPDGDIKELIDTVTSIRN